MELNPNHSTTQAVREHWHKLAAILMAKLGLDHVVITLADLERIPSNHFIVVQELSDGLHLRFVDEKTAHKLARDHGGLLT
jgi:hypothetical protein